MHGRGKSNNDYVKKMSLDIYSFFCNTFKKAAYSLHEKPPFLNENVSCPISKHLMNKI